MTGTVLLIGGTGKVGSKTARLLKEAGHSVLVASRSGEGTDSVKFDWSDPSTYENPYKADANIDRLFIIPPTTSDVLETAKPILDLAIAKGVKRFVYINGSTASARGEAPFGLIYDYLVEKGVDYTVLRASWFMENFATFLQKPIIDMSLIASVVADGRIPLMGTEDVAKAAYDALVAEKSANTDYLLVGPELYTYDEAVAILSEVVGRTITHKRISNEEEIEMFMAGGLPEGLAKFLNMLEIETSKGREEEVFKAPNAIKGKQDLRGYFEANKQLWIPQA